MESSAGSKAVEKYYRFHSNIYDATRWSFLFGRNRLLEKLPEISHPKNILEVGCGTGRNLLALHRIFPDAALCGVDISSDMLEIAENKLQSSGASAKLIHAPYEVPMHIFGDGFGLIVFSYCLSMINPGWENAVLAAKADLSPGGVIAVVDFKESRSGIYKKWMAMNHVKMEDHIHRMLEGNFKTLVSEKHDAYLGIWSYFLYAGTIPA